LDPDALAVLSHPLEDHDSIRDREERVILAALYVRARMDRGTALPNQDRPLRELPTPFL
jgi:hypothetical protein